MARKSYKPEEIIKLLRLVEIEVGKGQTTGLACKQLGFTEQSYYRWRKEYGGLQINQARRLKDLEKENVRLKKLVADLSLDKDILNEALRETTEPRAAKTVCTSCTTAAWGIRASCLQDPGTPPQYATSSLCDARG